MTGPFPRPSGHAFFNRFLARTAKVLAMRVPAKFIKEPNHPYFMIGCGRSGTTLLNSILSSHRDIAGYPDEANEMWHPFTYPWHQAKISVPPIWIDPYTFTNTSLQHRTAQDDQRIKSVFGMYQLLSGQKIVLNKTVMVTFMLPKVLELFPDAHFIHIVRDGRAVAHSYAKKQRQKMMVHDAYRREGYDFYFDTCVNMFAKHWGMHITAIEQTDDALALKKNGRLLELSYEAFCAQPYEQLKRITNFMKVKMDRFPSSDYSYVTSRNYKYQEALDDSVIKTIEQLMEPALRSKGYLI